MIEKTFNQETGTRVQCTCGKTFLGDDDHGPIVYALAHRKLGEHALLMRQPWVAR